MGDILRPPLRPLLLPLLGKKPGRPEPPPVEDGALETVSPEAETLELTFEPQEL